MDLFNASAGGLAALRDRSDGVGNLVDGRINLGLLPSVLFLLDLALLILNPLLLAGLVCLLLGLLPCGLGLLTDLSDVCLHVVSGLLGSRARLLGSVILGFLAGPSFSLLTVLLFSDAFFFLQLGLLLLSLSFILLFFTDSLFGDALVIFLGFPADPLLFFSPQAVLLFPETGLFLALASLLNLLLLGVLFISLLSSLVDLGLLLDVLFVFGPGIRVVPFLILALYPLLVLLSPGALLLDSLFLD